MTRTVLRIDASARRTGSITRDLSDRIINRLAPETVITRDLTDALPQIDEDWMGANFTPAAERTAAQQDSLALSDALIDEIKQADTLVIGLPIYNFSVPAALKAWIDQIARAGVTFQYTENGPRGLLEDKRAIFAVASGGTEVGSDIDFATGYLRHIMGFIGISDVEIVHADRMAVEPEETLKAAHAQVEDLAA
ncbi:FMN-dependent NADH-azoreductase [Cognatishimia sp. MH4019]|uniref:FMN-dependent NADH-azoreductase n=1 Tax=Cognatishimia sp. MH4019 TaxID=2854030 RepID=UPI001CD27BC4|nr:NAD(P)H-dependent oxidoreductase [Cognatishimia sp. MH4019]